MWKKLKNWWQKKPKSDKFYLVSLFIIVILAFGLRAYNLKDSQQFLGDQGRDALIVARIFKQHDPVFIGPVTSVGNMYLGPLYYYWMLPWLMLTYPSPMGPIWAMVILGTLAVALTYFLGKEMVGQKAALLASLILALMPAAVLLSRFSWNPNPAPLVSLVMIWATFRAVKKSKKYWILVVGAFSILVQLHYVTLLTLPTAGLIWLWQLYGDFKLKNKKTRQKEVLDSFKYAGLGILIFLISIIPLVLFDFKHDFLNAKAFMGILGEKGFDDTQVHGALKLWRALKETHGRSMHILYEVIIGKNRQLNTFLLIVLTGWFAYLIKFKSLFKRRPGFGVVLVYLLIGIVGLSFYTQSVFDHYIAYLYPVAALTLGLALTEVLRLQKVVGVILIAGFITLESLFLARINPWTSAGLTLDEVSETADLIAQEMKDKDRYNLVLLDEAKDLYGMKYRYFLDSLDLPVVAPEYADKTHYLVIIDERIDRSKNPFSLNIYELRLFKSTDIINHLIGPDGQDIWVLKRN